MSSPSADRPSRSRRIRAALLGFFVLQAIGLVAAAWIWASLQNTLARNGRWISGKESVAMSVMGARAYMHSRQTLANERLDLGRWHGYQEVLTRRQFDVTEVAFDFRLTGGAWFLFVFDRTPEGFSGLRLSASPHYEDAWLTARSSGEITRRRPIGPLPGLRRGEWIHLTARFEPDVVRVELNGIALEPFEHTLAPRHQVGFRAGQNRVRVDDVEIRERSGAVFRESFFNRRDFVIALGLGALVLAAASAALLALFRRLPRLRAGGLKLALSMAAAAAGVALVLVWQYRTRLGQGYRAPPAEREDAYRAAQADEVIARIERDHTPRPAPGVTRVLFLGTSQTWGSGAERPEEAFVPRLEARLNADATDPRTYECVNGAISAFRSPELAELYRERWIDLAPDLVVVNLSNNDDRPQAFAAALDEIVRRSAERGIAVLFCLEPNSIERHAGPLPLHANMRAVAEQHGLALVDLHEHLKRRRRDGLLWWDSVHPTSFGHALIAEALEQEVRGID